MFSRSLARVAGQAASGNAGGGQAAAVPNCLCQFGNHWSFHYLNHPGVMAVSSLVEMRGVCRMRANFTQENIDAMKEYDIELARKAQIALDNGIAINFLDLERIEDTLPRLLKERDQIKAAREEVLSRKVGDYGPLKTKLPDFKPENFKLKMPDRYNKIVDTRDNEAKLAGKDGKTASTRGKAANPIGTDKAKEEAWLGDYVKKHGDNVAAHHPKIPQGIEDTRQIAELKKLGGISNPWDVYTFPMPKHYTEWRDEQIEANNTAVLEPPKKAAAPAAKEAPKDEGKK